MPKNFKSILKEKDCLFGSFLQLPSLEVAEIFSFGGFDFLIIDNEHSVIDPAVSQNMLRAIDATGSCAMIRVAECTETAIKKALDTGVSAVMYPGVTNARIAREVMGYAKYAPLGIRGACPGVRANRFGEGGSDYYERANRETAVVMLLEGREALEGIDEILEVDGIDVVFLGPVDMSMSLGVPGQTEHPEVEKAIRAIAEKARRKDIAVGMLCLNMESAKRWFDLGVNVLAYGIDNMIIRETVDNIVQTLRKF